MFTLLVILIVLSILSLLPILNGVLESSANGDSTLSLLYAIAGAALVGWIIFGVYCYSHLPK